MGKSPLVENIRIRLLKWFFPLLATILMPLVCETGFAKETMQEKSAPRFKKVVLVIFENENIDKPLSQPFFKQLADRGALLTDYHGVAHPSQPNYIALTSGDTQGIKDDDNHDLDAKNLADLLEAHGKTWKSYAEDFPGDCFTGEKKGRYVRKHVPFISYTDISKTKRCSRIVNADSFAADVKSGNLPDFSFYTPNMDDDGHDTDIGYGEKWFARAFEPLLKEKHFKDVLLIVTFDENECNTIGPKVTLGKTEACKGDSNQVYTVFYGRGVKPGSKCSVHADHYSLLKTIEEGFGLGDLGLRDHDAAAITGIWK